MWEQLEGYKTYITVAVIALGEAATAVGWIDESVFNRVFELLVMAGLVFARKGKVTATQLKEIRLEK